MDQNDDLKVYSCLRAGVVATRVVVIICWSLNAYCKELATTFEC